MTLNEKKELNSPNLKQLMWIKVTQQYSMARALLNPLVWIQCTSRNLKNLKEGCNYQCGDVPAPPASLMMEMNLDEHRLMNVISAEGGKIHETSFITRWREQVHTKRCLRISVTCPI